MTIAPWPVVSVRASFVVVGIAIWFWSQAVLAKRVPKVANEAPLTDGIHLLTARLHARYATRVAAGNRRERPTAIQAIQLRTESRDPTRPIALRSGVPTGGTPAIR